MKAQIKIVLHLFLFLNSLVFASENTSVTLSGCHPHALIVSQDNTKAYVTTNGCGGFYKPQIDAIDLKTMQLIGHVSFTVDYASFGSELFLSSDEKKLYAYFDEAIFVINTNSFKIQNIIDFDKLFPDVNIVDHQAFQSPDKTKIYFSLADRDDLRTHYPLKYFPFDIKTDKFPDPIPEKISCDKTCIHSHAGAISPSGKTIYAVLTKPHEPESLVTYNVSTNHHYLLGLIGDNKNIKILKHGLILSKNGKTFYASVHDEKTQDWHIYSIDKKTMQHKTLYTSEHEIEAFGLSNDEQQLYILDFRHLREKIIIIGSVTGQLINILTVPPYISLAKVSSSPSLKRIYFVSEGKHKQKSTFYVMTLNENGYSES